jgi:hypothetical protein
LNLARNNIGANGAQWLEIVLQENQVLKAKLMILMNDWLTLFHRHSLV